MDKVQVCVYIERVLYDEYKEISEKSGLSVSRLLELKLKGYRLESIKERERE